VIHSHTFDRFSPPEYTSDNEAECSVCRAFLDRDDEPYTEMEDGSLKCADCREMCSGSCGEWLTGLAIRKRCSVIGKLEPWCPMCAAEDELVKRLDWLEETAASENQKAKAIFHRMALAPNVLKEFDVSMICRLYNELTRKAVAV
jgi:hypothetical protein